jgi:uncharacterized protein YabN with tetrapyrrole methylase and pyrophosphatase domain
MDLFKKMYILDAQAINLGFKWENAGQIMAQIKSECDEIMFHIDAQDSCDTNQSELQEEIGDLLHAVLSLNLFCGFNPSDTLEKSLSKFERRLTAVKDISEEQRIEKLDGLTFDELMAIWQAAKIRVG